ncbi:MAG: TonB family protein [Bacteroidales bacterium]|nr:TonB family protein [Bacteroidales bacterium]
MAEKQNKYKGIAGTVLFHLILFFLLIFMGLSTPLPLPEEEGVEVNLGTDTEGSGAVQPEATRASAPENVPPPAESSEDENISTQVAEEAPVIENKGREKPKPVPSHTKPVNKEPVEEKPVVNPDALYKGKNKQTGEQVNQGETGGEGDQGMPDGTPDASNYIGPGGQGDGLSFNLTGRSPKYLPKPSNAFNENGTVVVQITVDKYGKVTRSVAIDKGSNTTSATLRKLAVEAAGKAIFNANPDAPEEQKGTITYHFIVKN